MAVDAPMVAYIAKKKKPVKTLMGMGTDEETGEVASAPDEPDTIPSLRKKKKK